MLSQTPLDASQPTGTVTLVFTDIEGSTGLLQALGDRYPEVLAEHHRLIREAFARHGASERGSAGDGLYFVFHGARAAVQAAVDGQLAIAGHDWPDGIAIRDRMGLHTGEPRNASEGYVGLDVHRAARICAAGHGGQILISQTTRDLIAEELRPPLGVVDLGAHRLRSLDGQQRLYQVSGPGLARDFPPPRTSDAPRNNLKLEVTSFIGRERELEQASRILEHSSILTLTGPGGVGKTRVGLRLARVLMDQFEDGAWVVDCGALTDPDFVLPSVVSTIGLTESAGRPLLAAIVDYLKSKRLLLVLDDADPVLAECAELAGALARSCSAVRVVVTSREALGVPGEAILPIASLGTPEVGSTVDARDLGTVDACRLFVERASAVQPTFGLTDQNARSVAQLCRRLDGIPLAIELAAARVRALPVEQIAARLDDRFRLLTGGSRASVARHQTLRATIDWSYDLLTEPERAVLRRLSVFAGGAALDAAESVCAGDPVEPFEILDVLGRLVEKSLIFTDPTASEARFRLLETVREYARGRLVEEGEGDATLRRHRDWYLRLVDEASPGFFHGPEPIEWLQRIDREHDDIRAVLEWCLDQPGEGRWGLRIAAGLWRYWEIRGYLAEGRGWLERMVEAAGDDVSPLRADALTGAGTLALMQGDFRAASTFHESSLAVHRQIGDPQSIAYAANNLANAALQLGDHARARALYEEAVTLTSELGDKRGAAFGSINLADVVTRQGDLAAARALHGEILVIIRELGDRWMEAFALDSFARATSLAGDREAARSLHGDALAILEEMGDRRGVARVMTHLAALALSDGETAQARGLFRQSLAIRQDLGDMPGLASAMENLAGAIAIEDAEAAARLHGAAESLREAIRAMVPPQAAATHDQTLADLEARLGTERLETARREGRLMTPNEALATLPL
ncbi:MAG: tetratricopeptide repeat protein [Chloroflexota bacterium]|nr:tetratricopeptide repeat protein [Chloroflexota bacterium]